MTSSFGHGAFSRGPGRAKSASRRAGSWNAPSAWIPITPRPMRHWPGRCCARLAGFRVNGISQLVESAFRHAEEGLRLDPNDFYSHWTLGTVLARKQRPEESLEAIRTALQLNPNAAELHLHMVQPLVRLG